MINNQVYSLLFYLATSHAMEEEFLRSDTSHKTPGNETSSSR